MGGRCKPVNRIERLGHKTVMLLKLQEYLCGTSMTLTVICSGNSKDLFSARHSSVDEADDARKKIG